VPAWKRKISILYERSAILKGAMPEPEEIQIIKESSCPFLSHLFTIDYAVGKGQQGTV